MILCKILLISVALITLGCESSPEKSSEKDIKVPETATTTSNGLKEFYDQIRSIKFEKPYIAHGQSADLIIDLFQKKELANLNVNQVQFSHNISDVFRSSYGSSSKNTETKIGLISGVPADAVLHSIMQGAGLWHLNDFTDGTLTINCWSKPDIDDDYEE